MDIFSHGLYGGIATGRKSKKDYLIALLFGVGPDLLSFGLFFLINLFKLKSFFGEKFGQPDALSDLGMFGRLPVFPDFIYSLYNITHSLVIYALFFALIYFLGKKSFAKLTLAWPLHILVDIPTHSNAFFPTPFLWPLSDFSVNGIPWSSPIIFIPNVIVIVSLYTFWYFKRKRLKVV